MNEQIENEILQELRQLNQNISGLAVMIDNLKKQKPKHSETLVQIGGIKIQSFEKLEVVKKMILEIADLQKIARDNLTRSILIQGAG